MSLKKDIKVKTDKSFINRDGISKFTKYNHRKLAEEIIEENPNYKELINPDDDPTVFLINIGFILVDEGIDKMLIYRSKSLSPKSKKRLDKLKKKFQNYSSPSIHDYCEDETEEDSIKIENLLEKLRELEKSKETDTIGGEHGR